MRNRISHIAYRISFKISFLLLAISYLPFAILGCGYTTRSMLSTKYKTIYIMPFINTIDITKETDVASKYKVYRPKLESDITTAVTNKYLFDGNLRPAKKERADLVLKGELVEYRRDPLRYTDGDEVAEYRMNLIVNISLWDNREDKLLWEEKGFTGYFQYFTDRYPLTNEPRFSDSDDQTPLSKALEDLARRVVERTVNEW